MKILIAVDEAHRAHETARVANELFPSAEHSIISSASVPTPIIVDPTGMAMAADLSTPADAAKQAEEAVEAAQAEFASEGATLVAKGDAGRAICKQAIEQDVDLIVVGRRASDWLSRLFDPSVSDYLVHHAPCSVLVVRERIAKSG